MFLPRKSNYLYYSSDRTPIIPKGDRPPHPKQRSPSHIPKAIALPHPKRDRTTHISRKAIPTERLRYLRYRTPTSSKQRFLRSASLSLSYLPQQAIPTVSYR